MRPTNDQVLSAVTVSTTSSPLPSAFQVQCSVQAIATGTLAGTVKLQFTNDKAITSSTLWSDIPSATVAISGTAGAFAIPVTSLCYEFVQVVFIASTGAGTLTANYKSYGF